MLIMFILVLVAINIVNTTNNLAIYKGEVKEKETLEKMKVDISDISSAYLNYSYFIMQDNFNLNEFKSVIRNNNEKLKDYYVTQKHQELKAQIMKQNEKILSIVETNGFDKQEIKNILVKQYQDIFILYSIIFSKGG